MHALKRERKVHAMLIAVEGHHYIPAHLSNKKCSIIYTQKGSIKIELPELNKSAELHKDQVIAGKSLATRQVTNTTKK